MQILAFRPIALRLHPYQQKAPPVVLHLHLGRARGTECLSRGQRRTFRRRDRRGTLCHCAASSTRSVFRTFHDPSARPTSRSFTLKLTQIRPATLDKDDDAAAAAAPEPHAFSASEKCPLGGIGARPAPPPSLPPSVRPPLSARSRALLVGISAPRTHHPSVHFAALVSLCCECECNYATAALQSPDRGLELKFKCGATVCSVRPPPLTPK